MFRLIHRKKRVILHRLFQGTKQYFRSIATIKSIMCFTYLATISTNSRHIPTATLKTSNNFDFTIIRRNALLLVVRGIPTEYSAPIISPRRHHSSLFFRNIRPPYQNSVTYQNSGLLPYLLISRHWYGFNTFLRWPEYKLSTVDICAREKTFGSGCRRLTALMSQ